MGLDMVGRQLDGTAKTGNRLVRLLHRLVSDTQIRMKHGDAALQANGAKDLVCRQIVVSRLKCHQTEQMPGVGILGRIGKNLSIDVGCGIQLPRVVILQGKGKPLVC